MNIKPLHVVLLGAAAYIGYKIVNKTLLIKNLAFQINSVSPSIQGITPKLKIIIAIQNPTSDSLDINAVVGDVYINGDYVGNVANLNKTSITPYASVSYTVDVSLSALPIILDIIRMIQGQSAVQAVLRLVGTVTVEDVPFPLDLTRKLI